MILFYYKDLNCIYSALKELLTVHNQPICFLIDDFHVTFKKDDISWLNSVLGSNIKCIITISNFEESMTDLISISDFKLLTAPKIEVLKMKCSEAQWKDIISHGVGDVCTTGTNVDLLQKWSNTEERILLKAKVFVYETFLTLFYYLLFYFRYYGG